jgi:hypothetical protein
MTLVMEKSLARSKQNRNRIPVQRQSRLILSALIAWGLWAIGGCGGTATDTAGEARGLEGRTGAAKFTIVLAQYDFADRDNNAQRLMQRASEVLKTNDIWLEKLPRRLSVNYGRFDKNTPKSLIQQEFKRVKKLYRQLDAGPYQFSFIRELPEPDPPAPAEWSLLNQTCYYSLEIGAYYNVPEKEYYSRKEDAVKAVKGLRASGDPAFFVHGQHETRIYIGCMPHNVTEPFVKLVQKKYPYRFENGAQVSTYHEQADGQKVKVPNPSVVIEVEPLKSEIPF